MRTLEVVNPFDLKAIGIVILGVLIQIKLHQ